MLHENVSALSAGLGAPDASRPHRRVRKAALDKILDSCLLGTTRKDSRLGAAGTGHGRTCFPYLILYKGRLGAADPPRNVWPKQAGSPFWATDPLGSPPDPPRIPGV